MNDSYSASAQVIAAALCTSAAILALNTSRFPTWMIALTAIFLFGAITLRLIIGPLSSGNLLAFLFSEPDNDQHGPESEDNAF